MLEFSAMHSVSKYGLGRDVACLPPFPLLFKVLHIDRAFSSEGLSNHQHKVILKKSVTGKKRTKSTKRQHQNGDMCPPEPAVCFSIGLLSITRLG